MRRLELLVVAANIKFDFISQGLMAYPFNAHMLPDRIDLVTLKNKTITPNASVGGNPPDVTKPPQKTITAEALCWPANLGGRDTYTPALVAAGIAFLGVPYFYPGASVGISMLIGYAAGSADYLVMFGGDDPLV